ncbi:MAG TPA: ABC transporter ATP-binding protein [Gemmatimonadales bacterium]|jgi:oligopeptide/dipeptide ABC transporter ATP-binding protein
MTTSPPVVGPALLEIRDLRITFRTADGIARAVDGVDIDVQAGETVGLVGESGCGKSVTSLAILRLVDDGMIGTGSSIRLEGRDIMALPGKELRAIRGNHAAIVFQEPASALNPVLSIGDQVAEAVTTHQKVSKKEAWDRAVEMLKTVGIPDAGSRARGYPHQLSGGMRQRVLIAMALICRPRLLIADEPTTALDVTIQAEILALLEDLQRKLGMAVLLITHNLSIVAESAQRVYVMYAGQIVEQATTAMIFAKPAHPYTEGLLAAIPRLDQRRDRLEQITGQVPPATAWPSGCRFHPRCPYAWDKCRTEMPPLLDAGPGQKARCWLVEEPERRADGRTGKQADQQKRPR